MADVFVVSKEERSVLEYRSANRSAKLVPLERRNCGSIEEISGVQCAIAEELVTTAVKLIGSGARNIVNDSSGGLAVLRRVVAGQHGELLNGVDAQASSQNAAGRSVGVIVETNAVQTIVVLLGPCAGNSQLLPETAISSIRPRREA